MNNHEILLEVEQPIEEKKKRHIKTYYPPRLEKLGDLRAQTLGSSPSPLDDSGPNIATTHVPIIIE